MKSFISSQITVCKNKLHKKPTKQMSSRYRSWHHSVIKGAMKKIKYLSSNISFLPKIHCVKEKLMKMLPWFISWRYYSHAEPAITSALSVPPLLCHTARLLHSVLYLCCIDCSGCVCMCVYSMCVCSEYKMKPFFFLAKYNILHGFNAVVLVCYDV